MACQATVLTHLQEILSPFWGDYQGTMMGFITPIIRPALSWGGGGNLRFSWKLDILLTSEGLPPFRVLFLRGPSESRNLILLGTFQSFLLNQIYDPSKKLQKIAISQVFLVRFSNLPVHLSFLKDVLTGFALHAAQAAELLERYCHSAAPFWHEKLRLYPLVSNEENLVGWVI